MFSKDRALFYPVEHRLTVQSCFFLVINRNVFEMTEKRVISVKMSENTG